MLGRRTFTKGAKKPYPFNLHADKGTVMIADPTTTPAGVAYPLISVFPPDANGEFPTHPTTGICTTPPLSNYNGVVCDFYQPGAAMDRLIEHSIDTADVQILECTDYLCQVVAYVVMSEEGGNVRREVLNGMLRISAGTD